MQAAIERIQHQSQFFQSHGTQQRFVAVFAKHDWRVTLAHFQLNQTLSDVSFDLCAV